MDRAERGHKPKGFARKAPGRANKRQAANRKKRKTTGSEDDLEWTKALSSTPPDRGSAGGVSGRRAVPAGLVEPEEGYGNAAHVEIEEKQKTFSLNSHNRLEKPKSGFSTFPQPRLLGINH
ncbi:MAG: hypothetical protein IPN69_07280 [Acidobacteria bacterium]|nr:hypothetical protein [Acidobacteriota bacterium]MBK8810522.1 hypothetical protein [Acidobacteriota bacterium]